MKTPSISLIDVFKDTLNELYNAEKQYSKYFMVLSRSALTKELMSALAPSQTEIEIHMERLKQIMRLQNIKLTKATSVIDDELIKNAKLSIPPKQSLIKDIQILHWAKIMGQAKIVRYELLFLMAVQLELELPSALLEQCFKDNKNTDSYLTQIAQNIIFPMSAAKD